MVRDKKIFKEHLSMVVLSILRARSMYGYRLAQAVKERSAGLLELKEGALYPTLHRLVKEGYLTSEWGDSASGPRRRYYRLTTKGRKVQEEMVEKWKQFSGLIDQLVGVTA
ncbi:MAG: helix-turn-helix transcriptional regulator [Planctomycetes bacterium]|nr:helix-turn-helix transcriptional regulator [Planctomycetota bacterium]